MRRWALAVAVLTLTLSIASPAAAHHQPSPFVKGNAGAFLLGDWWALVLSTPVPVNPAAGNADRCIRLGHHVLAPALIQDGEISCTADRRTFVLPLGLSTECSDAEEPPFFGATPRARRACAIAADDGITTNQVGIDGRVYDINRYRVQSPDRKVRLPEDDIFGLDARSMRFTADGWAALIEPLRPGHHVITVRSAGKTFDGNPIVSTGTLRLEVTRR